jgi:hypothetical protein
MTGNGSSQARRRWTRGEQLVAVAGALLILDLLLVPWHSFGIDVSELEQFGIQLPEFDLQRRAVQDPQAFFGIASTVIAALMVIQVVASKVSSAVPRVEQLHLVAGAVTLGLVVAKLMANDDFLAVGAYLGVGLAAALAYGGFLLSQETGAGTGRTVSNP